MFKPVFGTGTGQEHDGGVGFRAREKRAAAKEVDEAPLPEERRPNRRKTSEVVTRMEMMIRTMMIQVWSWRVSCLFGESRIWVLTGRLAVGY